MWRATLSCLSLSIDTLDSKNNVSTANADTLSDVVKLAEEIDESVAVSYGMVPLMKSSRAKQCKNGLPVFPQRSFACCAIFLLTLLDVSTHRVLSIPLVIKKNDREISFHQQLEADVPLYQEAERVQWDEWVTHGSVKIHSFTG